MSPWELDADTWAAADALVDELFDADPGARAERLAAEEPELRRVVERLLAAIDTTDAEVAVALESPIVAEVDLDSAFDRDAAVLSTVGPWAVGAPLGRGGMGTVFRGRRADGAFQQQVALKVLRRGLDTEDIVRRFVAERQVLANLDHPCITRLLDGGETDDGRPWFAMELVEGEPLDVWVTGHAPPERQRLELFARACDAVAYAHQRLIVHRDLKPAHVVVTADGTPRLLDFGVAKLLAPGPGEAGADLTRTGNRWMTPGWAAPEQSAGEPVTTATDVYALGGLLHVALTGKRPEGQGRVRGLSPDLAAMVEKARAVAPTERYRTADALAADVRRYLAGEPVVARRLGTLRRGLKWMRRHWLATSVVAAFMAVVAGWAVTATLQADALREQRDIARREAQRATRTARFLERTVTAADPRNAMDRAPTVTEALQAALSELETDTDAAADPIYRAQLQLTLGRGLLAASSQREEGTRLIRDALATLRQELGDVHQETGRAFLGLAQAHLVTDAFPAMVEAATRAGKALVEPRDRARAARMVADGNARQGRHEAAYAAAKQAVELLRPVSGAQLELAEALALQGLAADGLGRNAEAARLLEEALTAMEAQRGAMSPALVPVLNAMAAVDFDDVARRDAIRKRQVALLESLGPRPDLNMAAALNNQAIEKFESGDRGALEILRKAARIAAQAAPEDHWGRLQLEMNLGGMMRDLGALDDAEPLLKRVSDKSLGFASQSPLASALAPSQLGQLRFLQGRHQEAVDLQVTSAERATAMTEEGPKQLVLALALARRGEALAAQGKLHDAKLSVMAGINRHRAGNVPAQGQAHAWLVLAGIERKEQGRISEATRSVLGQLQKGLPATHRLQPSIGAALKSGGP